MLQILLAPSLISLELICHLSMVRNNMQSENLTPKHLETAWWLVLINAVSTAMVSILPLRAISRIPLATTATRWVISPLHACLENRGQGERNANPTSLTQSITRNTRLMETALTATVFSRMTFSTQSLADTVLLYWLS